MKINNSIAKKLKKDFPIFKKNRGLVYLDNAATSQRPKQVIDSVKSFSERDNANIHRGLYTLAERAMQNYDNSRKVIAKFINAGSSEEIIFTKNTTEAINLLSYTLNSIIPKKKTEIVLTEMEHHSNLIPWQQFAKKNKMKLKFIKMNSDFTLDIDDAAKKITKKTAIVTMVHVSNVLGTVNPIEKIISIAKKQGALTVIDAAQSVPHMKVDVKKLGCDFLAFSSHKMLGPTGIGVLYGRKELLKKMSPFLFGGGMIKKVDLENAEWADIPEKFEAGTQCISESIALAQAIKYLEKIGMENIERWEKILLRYALMKMNKISGLEIYNPEYDKSIGLISFNLIGIHPHDVAQIMNEDGIAIRPGHQCAMPLMKILGAPGGVCRASFYFYNTFEDIDKMISSILKIKKKFS